MKLKDFNQKQFNQIYEDNDCDLLITARKVFEIFQEQERSYEYDKMVERFIEYIPATWMQEFRKTYYYKNDEDYQELYNVISVFANDDPKALKEYSTYLIDNFPSYEYFHNKNVIEDDDIFNDLCKYNFDYINDIWDDVKHTYNPDYNYDYLYQNLFTFDYNYDEYFKDFDFSKLDYCSIKDYTDFYLNLYIQHCTKSDFQESSINALNENLNQLLIDSNIICLNNDKKKLLIEKTFDVHLDVLKTNCNNKYVRPSQIQAYIENIDFDFLENLKQLNNGKIPARYQIGNFFNELIDSVKDNTVGYNNIENIISGINGIDLDTYDPNKEQYTKIIRHALDIDAIRLETINEDYLTVNDYKNICNNNLKTEIRLGQFYHSFNDINIAKILSSPDNQGKQYALELLEKSLLKVIETCQKDNDYFNFIKNNNILENKENFNLNNLCSFEQLDIEKVDKLFKNANLFLKDYDNKLNQLKQTRPLNLSSIDKFEV